MKPRMLIAIWSLIAGIGAAQVILLNDERYAAQGLHGLTTTIGLTERTFVQGTRDDCSVSEGCASYGLRRLITFEQVVVNIGTTNTALPTAAEHPDLFEFDSCHGHTHIINWSLFELFDCRGTLVKTSAKRGWCVLPSIKVDPSAGPASTTFSCTSPGLNPGWADRYGVLTSCQWLDATGIPDGNYKLRVWLDPLGIFGIRQYVEQAVQITGAMLSRIASMPPCEPPPQLNVSIATDQVSYKRRQTARLTVTVQSTVGLEQNAVVNLNVNFPRQTLPYILTTDTTGQASTSIYLHPNYGTGTVRVSAQANKQDRQSGTATKTFTVTR